MTDLGSIASWEASGAAARVSPPDGRAPAPLRDVRPTAGRGPGRRWWPLSGRVWAVLWGAAVGWSVFGLLPDDGGVINVDGLSSFGEFWAYGARPQISPAFLRQTADAAMTTLAFGALATVLSVLVGLLFAPLLSETAWAPTSAAVLPRLLRRAGLVLARASASLPRGVHEAVWGLLLIAVLGRDPLVGVLAIAIPFGAITAKVFSELLDEADLEPYELLRAAGVGRARAFLYGAAPTLVPSVTSYAFYRFECSIRSAVILGMIGAGGLGLQLSLSFSGAQHAETWTSLYALVALGAVIDRWGAWLRRGTSPRRWQLSAAAGMLLMATSVWHLAPDVSRWFSKRTVDLLARLVQDLVPPRLPDGGWPVLVRRTVETLEMSVVAISLATALGLAVALLAARGSGSSWRRAIGWAARQLLLFTRSVPPPVWALLVLFVVFPGPLPGALALGIYTFGILGRLFAEVVEELEQQPRRALAALGAPPLTAFAYASVPAAGGQLIAYTLYRWEVTARETVVVGVVGAGGLGRLLEQQRAAFDYPAMTTTVLALICLSLVVDLLSLAMRNALR